jgi:hypothetical protein
LNLPKTLHTSILRYFQNTRLHWVAFVLLFTLLFGNSSDISAQNISGQWIGNFTSEEDPEGSGTDYVLEIESNGSQLSGYSYTYFSIAGKRYFVICKLKGTYDKGSKSMVISEIETVKTNTPPDFENCHQSHQLTYLKQKDKETLVGKWKPFEKGSTCGKGFTSLERKALIKENNNPAPGKSNPTVNKSNKPSPNQAAKPTPAVPKNQSISKINPKQQLAPKQTPKPQLQTIAKTPVKPLEKPKLELKEENLPTPPKAAQQTLKDNFSEKKTTEKPIVPFEGGKAKNIPENTKEKLSKRTYQVIKVIEVSAATIKVEIYDNGQIDGDVVSIFLNEKQLISSKMLTAQPITIQIKVEDNEDEYDLIMYAESLGSIPPNTALMVVTTPTQRYEINISSNEQTSGAIRFKLKK